MTIYKPFGLSEGGGGVGNPAVASADILVSVWGFSSSS